MGLAGGSDSKESPSNAGDLGLISGLGRSPREWNGYPLQYSYLENIWEREAYGLQFMVLQKVGHDWVIKHTHKHSNGHI